MSQLAPRTQLRDSNTPPAPLKIRPHDRDVRGDYLRDGIYELRAILRETLRGTRGLGGKDVNITLLALGYVGSRDGVET